jgi:dihydroorotate dehydrogenase electron transfer subunit
VVGRGTALLSRLSPGEPLGVLGPLGNGFSSPVGRPVLIGGGTGIASLYEFAVLCGRRARVLLGGRTREDILGLEAFLALDLDVEVATEDGSLGRAGRVTELLAPEPGDEWFACGPTAMMRVVAERASAAGLPCRVSLESQMACGIGICLGCAVPTHDGFRYVCTHGPVFDAERLVWAGLP